MLDKCDSAGIWEKDLDWATIHTGLPVTENDALLFFKERIKVIDAKYWMISKFVHFQCGGPLYENCIPHQKIVQTAAKHGIVLTLLKGRVGGRVGVGYGKGSHTLQEEEEDKEPLLFGGEGGGKKRFSAPTPEEVSSYAKTIGFEIDGAQFVDYYSSRGWKIGNSAMKEWKAAVRLWKRNQKGEASGKPKQQIIL